MVKSVVFLCVMSPWVLLWMCWASLRFLSLLLGDSASLLGLLWLLSCPFGFLLAVSWRFLGPLMHLLATLGHAVVISGVWRVAFGAIYCHFSVS